jgi:hypothetical protein
LPFLDELLLELLEEFELELLDELELELLEELLDEFELELLEELKLELLDELLDEFELEFPAVTGPATPAAATSEVTPTAVYVFQRLVCIVARSPPPLRAA